MGATFLSALVRLLVTGPSISPRLTSLAGAFATLSIGLGQSSAHRQSLRQCRRGLLAALGRRHDISELFTSLLGAIQGTVEAHCRITTKAEM